MLNLPGPLLFETGSDVPSVSAKTVLAKLAADLHALDIKKLRLFSHTDNVGSAEFNRGLSSKRAEAVAFEMVVQGFADNALKRRAFGFDGPIAGNDTPEGRTKNRRVGGKDTFLSRITNATLHSCCVTPKLRESRVPSLRAASLQNLPMPMHALHFAPNTHIS